MTIERWSKLTLTQQMANIGSEFQRFLSWKKKGNREYQQQALHRLLELWDLTIAVRSGPQLKELTRLREVICDDNLSVMLQNYFLNFGVLARKL